MEFERAQIRASVGAGAKKSNNCWDRDFLESACNQKFSGQECVEMRIKKPELARI